MPKNRSATGGGPTNDTNLDATFLQYKKQGEALGLKGKDLVEFVREREHFEAQRERERMELEAKRERERMDQEAQRERERMEREREQIEREFEQETRRLQFELEAKKIDSQTTIETTSRTNIPASSRDKIKLSFLEDKDDIETFLSHFERVAHINKWGEEEWGARLAPLLKGKAREAYVTLPVEESNDYEAIKNALLKRYRLTAQTYRQKFRSARPESNEEDHVYWERLETWLQRWITLSEKKEVDLKWMLIAERFLETQPLEKARFIREREPQCKEDIIKTATLFQESREAERRHGEPRNNHVHTNHNGMIQQQGIFPKQGNGTNQHEPNPGQHNVPPRRQLVNRQTPREPEGPPSFLRKLTNGCYHCGGQHRIRNCPIRGTEQTAAITTVIASVHSTQKTGLCKECERLPFSPHCQVKVEGKETAAIRDTGATTTVVSRDLVPDKCYTGNSRLVTLASDQVKQTLDTAVVKLETPYFKGAAEVVVMDKPVAPVLIGNTRYEGGKEMQIPVYPKEEIVASSNTDCSRLQPPRLKRLKVSKSPISSVTPDELKKRQAIDSTLSQVPVLARQGDDGITRTGGGGTQNYFKTGILTREVQDKEKMYYLNFVKEYFERKEEEKAPRIAVVMQEEPESEQSIDSIPTRPLCQKENHDHVRYAPELADNKRKQIEERSWREVPRSVPGEDSFHGSQWWSGRRHGRRQRRQYERNKRKFFVVQ